MAYKVESGTSNRVSQLRSVDECGSCVVGSIGEKVRTKQVTGDAKEETW